MRLERVQISNFKLLEDVVLEFATQRDRPLTAIRAENGSGKTSLLLAMLWGFYGRPGLPKFAAEARLTSLAAPLGTPVSVWVMIEFEYDGPGGRARYRLLRSAEETPVGIDEVRRGSERVAAYQITDAGEDPIADPDTFLRQVVPHNLRDIFFTNGDDVQEVVGVGPCRWHYAFLHTREQKGLLNVECFACDMAVRVGVSGWRCRE